MCFLRVSCCASPYVRPVSAEIGCTSYPGLLSTVLTPINQSQNAKEANANEIAMLLANLAKSDSMLRLLKLKRAIPKFLSTSPMATDQLMDCFVKGAGGSYNKEANYDYLSYFFADLSKVRHTFTAASTTQLIKASQHAECRAYFLSTQPTDDNIVPLSKILVFTEHTSHIRRLGVASTIKNVTFDIDSHPKLLAPHYVSFKPSPLLTISNGTHTSEADDQAPEPDPLNVLPYILLPLCGASASDFSSEDMEDMLEDLQLLPSDKKREPDHEILKTHLETLLLLTTQLEGRETLRKIKVYPVVRELHISVEDEDVRESVDRLVQVIMRDEAGEGGEDGKVGGFVDVNATSSVEAQDVNRVGGSDSDEEVVEVL